MRGALSLACGRIGNAEQQHEREVADGENCRPVKNAWSRRFLGTAPGSPATGCLIPL